MSTLQLKSPFVLIKRGVESPSILIAHGLDGLASFSALAKQIRTDHAVYGIRAKGIDGVGAPFERVEDMAAFYLDSLRELQPHGPYILVGYSFGGLVALEMAQRLSEEKQTVALLALLDTYPHPRFLQSSLRVSLYLRRIRTHFRQMSKLPPRKAFSYFTSALKRRVNPSSDSQQSQRNSEGLGFTVTESALQNVKKNAYLAYENYRPKFYRGKIKFVTTETKTFFPADPSKVWGQLTEEFEVDVIPGDHLNIVNAQFEGLAEILTSYIQEVPSTESNDIPLEESKFFTLA